MAGCSTAKCIDLVKRTALCVAKNTVSIPTYKDGEPVKLGDKVAIAGHAYKVRSLRVYPNDERTEVLVMREGSPIVGEEPFWTAFDKGLVKPYRSVDIRSISEDLHSFFSWCVEAEELSDDGVKRLLELVDEVDELAVEESKQRGAESNGNDSVKKN